VGFVSELAQWYFRGVVELIEQFELVLRLVGLLFRDRHLRQKLGPGTSVAGSSVIGPNRRGRAHELTTDDTDRGPLR
jgi:hypothetical protein